MFYSFVEKSHQEFCSTKLLLVYCTHQHLFCTRRSSFFQIIFQSSILRDVHVMKYLRESLSGKTFCRPNFIQYRPVLFTPTPSFIDVGNFAFSEVPLAAVRLSRIRTMSTLSQSVISSLAPCRFDLNLKHYHFLFYTFMFVAQCLLSFTYFCKNNPGLCQSLKFTMLLPLAGYLVDRLISGTQHDTGYRERVQ